MNGIDLAEGLYFAQELDDEFTLALCRAMYAAFRDGVLVVDELGFMVCFNQRFLDLWQIPHHAMQTYVTRSGVPGESPSMYAALAQLKNAEPNIEQAHKMFANPEKEGLAELEFVDGKVLESHSVGLFDRSDQHIGRVWFFRDITESKRAQKELREQAWHDPLTGALNRRHFFDRAMEEFKRARRHRRPLSVIMLDLDHFKSINDEYGHAAGDAVLETLCDAWRQTLRAPDLLCRLGGEEFALLLPECDIAGALAAAERLRLAVADNAVDHRDQIVHCTVSLGVATVGAGDSSIHKALARADQALYRAKHRGRDRVEVELGNEDEQQTDA